MDSKEYEQLISCISQILTNDSRLRDCGQKHFGANNKWEGASGFPHQIDVSLCDQCNALLIECKCWEKRIGVDAFLTHFARIIDIKNNKKWANLNIRGAIVTTQGWQNGVEKLVNHYSELCSVFVVKESGQVAEMIHTHYIKVTSIPSAEAVGNPTVLKSNG